MTPTTLTLRPARTSRRLVPPARRPLVALRHTLARRARRTRAAVSFTAADFAFHDLAADASAWLDDLTERNA